MLAQLEDIVCHIKYNIKERDREEDIDIDIKISLNIPKGVLDNSSKRKVDSSIDCRYYKAHTSAYNRYRDMAEILLNKDPGDIKGNI